MPLCWPPYPGQCPTTINGVCCFIHSLHALRPLSRPNALSLFVVHTLGCGCLATNCSVTPAPRRLFLKLHYRLDPVAAALKAARCAFQSPCPCPELNSGRPIQCPACQFMCLARHARNLSPSGALGICCRNCLFSSFPPLIRGRKQHHFCQRGVAQPFCCSLSRGEAEPSMLSARRGRILLQHSEAEQPLHSRTYHWF